VPRFFSAIVRPPSSPLFPYTTLFRSKLIQASAVLDLTEDDFDFLTSNKVWIATDRSRARRCVEACVYGTLDFVGYPRFPAEPLRSEERFSRNAETDLVCRLLLEKKKDKQRSVAFRSKESASRETPSHSQQAVIAGASMQSCISA